MIRFGDPQVRVSRARRRATVDLKVTDVNSLMVCDMRRHLDSLGIKTLPTLCRLDYIKLLCCVLESSNTETISKTVIEERLYKEEKQTTVSYSTNTDTKRVNVNEFFAKLGTTPSAKPEPKPVQPKAEAKPAPIVIVEPSEDKNEIRPPGSLGLRIADQLKAIPMEKSSYHASRYSSVPLLWERVGLFVTLGNFEMACAGLLRAMYVSPGLSAVCARTRPVRVLYYILPHERIYTNYTRRWHWQMFASYLGGEEARQRSANVVSPKRMNRLADCVRAIVIMLARITNLTIASRYMTATNDTTSPPLTSSYQSCSLNDLSASVSAVPLHLSDGFMSGFGSGSGEGPVPSRSHSCFILKQLYSDLVALPPHIWDLATSCFLKKYGVPDRDRAAMCASAATSVVLSLQSQTSTGKDWKNDVIPTLSALERVPSLDAHYSTLSLKLSHFCVKGLTLKSVLYICLHSFIHLSSMEVTRVCHQVPIAGSLISHARNAVFRDLALSVNARLDGSNEPVVAIRKESSSSSSSSLREERFDYSETIIALCNPPEVLDNIFDAIKLSMQLRPSFAEGAFMSLLSSSSIGRLKTSQASEKSIRKAQMTFACPDIMPLPGFNFSQAFSLLSSASQLALAEGDLLCAAASRMGMLCLMYRCDVEEASGVASSNCIASRPETTAANLLVEVDAICEEIVAREAECDKKENREDTCVVEVTEGEDVCSLFWTLESASQARNFIARTKNPDDEYGEKRPCPVNVRDRSQSFCSTYADIITGLSFVDCIYGVFRKKFDLSEQPTCLLPMFRKTR